MPNAALSSAARPLSLETARALHPFESELFAELRKRGRAVRLSICMTCGCPIGLELVDPCTTEHGAAHAFVSHGICIECLDQQDREQAARDGAAAWGGAR